VLAAHRAGIKTVSSPREDQKEISFHLVDQMSDVLRLTLEK
jgi:hypothetical protein